MSLVSLIICIPALLLLYSDAILLTLIALGYCTYILKYQPEPHGKFIGGYIAIYLGVMRALFFSDINDLYSFAITVPVF